MIDPEYAAFLATKAPRAKAKGIEPGPMPEHLFDYQQEVVSFLLKQPSGAAFLDTGLGKTRIQLEWCKQAGAASNDRTLILTPLAVARQIETEAIALGYRARVVRQQEDCGYGINICNYDRLDKLNTASFGAVSLDESSILKSFTGKTTQHLIGAFAKTPYKLCATATPAPNDHTEIGTHAEFLGIMTRAEMLVRWFINDSGDTKTWRLKGHAHESFWDWMASWARMAETPADLGYDATRFKLPELITYRHKTIGDTRPPPGLLFAGDVSATTMHDVKRQTAEARAQAAAELVRKEPSEPWILWCDTDYEQDAITEHLPEAVDVRGSLTAEKKEAGIAAFLSGEKPWIVSKSSVMGFGMNYQHCARQIFVGRSFSYEAWYQAVRRCWRFGQKRDVHVHLIVAEGEDQIGRVIDRKAAGHSEMKRAMAAAMQRNRAENSRVKIAYNPTHTGALPAWLSAA